MLCRLCIIFFFVCHYEWWMDRMRKDVFDVLLAAEATFGTSLTGEDKRYLERLIKLGKQNGQLQFVTNMHWFHSFSFDESSCWTTTVKKPLHWRICVSFVYAKLIVYTITNSIWNILLGVAFKISFYATGYLPYINTFFYGAKCIFRNYLLLTLEIV